MTTCVCPSCGASLPVTLASLRGVRCRACGFEGPPPPEVMQRLEVAQRELAQVDIRTRQLDAHARAAIGRALRVRWGVVIAQVVGGLPFVALGVLGIVMGIQHDGPVSNRVTGSFFINVPMILYAAVGYRLHMVVVRARKELLAACAAVPPERPGEPAACAVCGAPLLSRGVDPIVRCAHCSADNVVHPAAMAQASAMKSMDLDALTFALRSRAAGILATARRVTLATVAAVFGTPFVAFFTVLFSLLAANQLERLVRLAPLELPRYAWVETKRGGRCVGMIAREGDKTRAHFMDNDRLGPNPMTLDEDTAADLPRFAAGALVGQRVRTSSGAVGIVRGVYGAPVTNRESFVLDTGERGNVAGSCAASNAPTGP